MKGKRLRHLQKVIAQAPVQAPVDNVNTVNDGPSGAGGANLDVKLHLCTGQTAPPASAHQFFASQAKLLVAQTGSHWADLVLAWV